PGTIILPQLPANTDEMWGTTVASRYRVNDPVWTRTEDLLVPGLPNSRGFVTLFLHERRTPAGRRRVVLVNLLVTRGSRSGVVAAIEIRFFEPGTLLHPEFREHRARQDRMRQSAHLGLETTLGYSPWGSDLKLFAGQPDPTNPSRFSIGYVHNGVRGAFIFDVRDDESVDIRSDDGREIPIRFPESATRPAS